MKEIKLGITMQAEIAEMNDQILPNVFSCSYGFVYVDSNGIRNFILGAICLPSCLGTC